MLTSTQNRGFAGSVNEAIRQNISRPYWIISNFDLYAEPGEWSRILESLGTFEYGANYGSGPDEYGLFMLTPAAVKNIGLFDENFYPAYFDDNDYRYRAKLARCPLFSFPVKYTHETSSTINDNAFYKRKNNVTYRQLGQYYISKWGGVPGREEFKSPFNKHYPVDYWKFDPSRNSDLQWL